jgi:hypothetical protein
MVICLADKRIGLAGRGVVSFRTIAGLTAVALLSTITSSTIRGIVLVMLIIVHAHWCVGLIVVRSHGEGSLVRVVVVVSVRAVLSLNLLIAGEYAVDRVVLDSVHAQEERAAEEETDISG